MEISDKRSRAIQGSDIVYFQEYRCCTSITKTTFNCDLVFLPSESSDFSRSTWSMLKFYCRNIWQACSSFFNELILYFSQLIEFEMQLDYEDSIQPRSCSLLYQIAFVLFFWLKFRHNLLKVISCKFDKIFYFIVFPKSVNIIDAFWLVRAQSDVSISQFICLRFWLRHSLSLYII